MNYWKKILKYYSKIIFSVLLLCFFSNKISANNIIIEIQGNNFTDEDVILSLIKNKPEKISEDYSNYLIKTLDNSLLFEDVSVTIDNNKYIIVILEFPNIDKIIFNNNERLKDEELLKIANELNITNLNPSIINNFIEELTKIYESFGYNNSDISYYENLNSETNTVDLYFDINEKEITKINKILFTGNVSIDNSILRSTIKSKTKTLLNLFANNNFKRFIVENDIRKISRLYKDNGYIDINVDYKIEYLNTNRVNIFFNIIEGEKYIFSSIKINDDDEILNSKVTQLILNQISESSLINQNYSISNINKLRDNISDEIINSGFDFFEISSLEKIENKKVDILFNIKSVQPKYIKQINIYGNSRTYDYVIRRELTLIEGDAVYKSQLEKVTNKLKSLRLFKSVNVIEKELDGNLVDLEINVEENQTGTVNAGVSVGTLDGFAIVAGLSERNFYGTGRSVKALVSTSEDKTEFTFETTDRIFYENNVDISYKAKLKEEDFATTSSYKLDTFSTGIGISYDLTPKIRHKVDIDYLLKDYVVTNSSTVANAIANSSGKNASFLLRNILYYSTLNSGFLPKNGRSISFNNFIETPTSSSNGYLKNILTVKNYKKINKNIFSNQTRIGNVISLSNNDILTDDKFALGGRWLRGFDSFGAGPRESRTSYVGGNNLIVTKFDYSRELLNNADFPIFLNIFNDYGMLWENKTKPANNDNTIRASVGFGIKYYSPIGPIGFSWGFPIADENYDINRMFLFSVGNID